MNKQIIISLLILTIFCCKKKEKLAINESQFQNKTFSLFSESEKDTLTISFQDSTHQIYGEFWQGKIPWRISHYNNTNFLVLDNRVIGIKKMDKGRYYCTYIGLAENEFIIAERKLTWNKQLLYGTWIKKENLAILEYNKNDSIKKPPLPPPPIGFSEKDFKSPGYYEITKDSIKYFEYYSIEKSGFEINNTNEFLVMELGNEYDKEKNWQWNIKSLSNSIMVVKRSISKAGRGSYITDTLVQIKR